MTTRLQPAARFALALLCVSAAMCVSANSQQLPATPAPSATPPPAVNQSAAKSAAKVTPPPAAAPTMPVTGGETLDRVDAIVNGDLILDSDVNEELRFADFQSFGNRSDSTHNKALERLINRDLILQQQKIAPEHPITDADVDKEIAALRKTLPQCKQQGCATDAGWQHVLVEHGFTEQSFRERWRTRMVVLRFIEERFRMGVRITPDQIKAYYDKTMLPEYARQHVTAPPLASLSDRIQEVLLQQQVSSLLGDWLTSLRAQGSVIILKPGEVAP